MGVLAFKLRGGCEGGGKGYLGANGEVFTIGTSPDQHIFDARGNGDGGVCPTITGDHQNRVTDYTAIVVPTISVGAHDAAPDLNGQDQVAYALAIHAAQPLPHPRRLMPIECERLMHWPDNWTANGIDEKGRKYALADTPRYKLVGNGVGSPVAEWIGRRIASHLTETPQ
jgi:DNA (cytosine-5)-methyltransferase 1